MHLPAIIRDLSVILGVAAVVSFIFRLIRQPVVIGYIVAGIIVGPYTPQFFSVKDFENIQTLAELGVIFFMFSLGLDFSFRRLARTGVSSIGTASLEFVGMLFLGLLIARLLGWTSLDALFIGCMLAASSTTIIVKVFDELRLKNKRFTEHVFSLLIVEDLAAILLLVGLSNLTSRGELGAFELLVAGGQLALVVGSWVLIGMFLVPRFVRAVSRHGNEEMLTIVSIALCLGLVSAAAANHYSVALGAFIMGSILAETPFAEKIQTQMRPLRDMFGAVFFVSVGMLLNPEILLTNWSTILILAVSVIFGKLLLVSLGSLLTGQSIKTAISSGLSMGQIGEFSFIIATLGLTTKTISPKIYPIIVATSLVTTFTTPYLIRGAPGWVARFEGFLPRKWLDMLLSYQDWTQRRSLLMTKQSQGLMQLATYIANGVIVWAVFALTSERISPWLQEFFQEHRWLNFTSWCLALAMASPFIWAMFRIFRSGVQGSEEFIPASSAIKGAIRDVQRLLSRAGVVIMLGLLSLEFFPGRIAFALTIAALIVLGLFFRKRLEAYYSWLENQFAQQLQGESKDGEGSLAHLAPFSSRLVEIAIPLHSFLAGKTMEQSRLREKYDLNVVFIKRRDNSFVTAKAQELIFPEDRLLCFGSDRAIELLQQDIEKSQIDGPKLPEMTNFALRRIPIEENSAWQGVTIRQLKLTEKYQCLVVGIERASDRIQNPKSDLVLRLGDVLWVVGERKFLAELT